MRRKQEVGERVESRENEAEVEHRGVTTGERGEVLRGRRSNDSSPLPMVVIHARSRTGFQPVGLPSLPTTNRRQFCERLCLLRERQVRVACVRFIRVVAGESLPHIRGNICVGEPGDECVS